MCLNAQALNEKIKMHFHFLKVNVKSSRPLSTLQSQITPSLELTLKAVDMSMEMLHAEDNDEPSAV